MTNSIEMSFDPRNKEGGWIKFRINDRYDVMPWTYHICMISQGINVLVGPNGCGKSSTLKEIADRCREQKILCSSYDNIQDGNTGSISHIMAGLTNMDMQLVSDIMNSSEGYRIIINAFRKIKYGISKASNNPDKPMVLLIDGIDSGMSIDNINYIRNVLTDLCIKYPNLFIVVSANNYELAAYPGLHIIDTYTHKERRYFKGYQSYKTYIERIANKGKDR